MSEETFEQAAERLGHVLKRDEDGDIDIFAFSFGYCNGPECTVCHQSWCQHCHSADSLKPCDGGQFHRAFTHEKDVADWQRLVARYGPNGPTTEQPA